MTRKQLASPNSSAGALGAVRKHVGGDERILKREREARGRCAAAVDLEMSWEFCSTGVAMTVAAYFLLLRRLTGEGAFYMKVVRPLSEASFGVYLVHILILCPVVAALRPHMPTPATIAASAAATFVASSLVCVLGRKIPYAGKLVFG